MAPNSQFGAVVSYSKSCCSRSACCAARRSSRFCFIFSTSFRQELGCFFFTAAERQRNRCNAVTLPSTLFHQHENMSTASEVAKVIEMLTLLLLQYCCFFILFIIIIIITTITTVNIIILLVAEADMYFSLLLKHN